MTYCVAISLDEGFVLTSDSRTNAGVDQVSTYSKMFRFDDLINRSFVIMSAGNLATTQGVIEQLRRDIREAKPINLNTVEYLSDAADYIGDIIAEKIRRHADGQMNGVSLDATLIIAGQIQGKEPKAFMIYPQGNHILPSEGTPYLQIGESKYGKPVLDRFLTMKTPLVDAATCALISMDSTIKSNVSVGPPIEVLIYRKDSFDLSQHFLFGPEDGFLQTLSAEWSNKLNQAFSEMPRILY